MVTIPFSFDIKISPMRNGYLNARESRHNAIHVGRVVVVVRVAIVVDIHEVSRIAQVGRPLPPVVGSLPTAESNTRVNNKTNISTDYNQCKLTVTLC